MTGKRVASLALYLSAAVLALTAAAVLGLRLALANADRFRGPLVELLAQRLDTPVAVDGLRGRLRGWRPELVLEDVVIGAGEARLSLPRLTVTLAPWATLRARALRVDRLVAEGAALTLTHGDGALWTGTGNTGPALSLEALPERFALRDGTIRLRAPAGERSVVLTAVDADVARFPGGELGIAARARIPGVVEGKVTIGYRGGVGAAAGRSHLHARGVRLAAVADWLPQRMRPRGLGGRADVELWTAYDQGRLRDLRAVVSADDMSLHGVTASAVSGRARWRSLDDSGAWRLDLRDWRWHTPESSGRVDALALARDTGGWRFASPMLTVGPLRALALSVPALPSRWAEPLASLRPGGSLRDVRAAWHGEQWRVSAKLENLATEARAKWPGLGGVSGEVVAADRGGRFALQAREAALALPWLFREPLPYHSVSATGTWRHRDDGLWRVAASTLRLDSPDGQARGRAAFWFGVPGGPFLDIAAELEDGDGTHASRYFPVGVMPDDLVSWLDRAIGGGRAPHAQAVVFGPAKRFPFRGGEGHFHIRGRAVDVPFTYRPDWPAVAGAAGRLEFENESMRIDAEAGRIFGVSLSGASARIPELEHDPVLSLDIDASGPANDMLRYLRESPLADEAPPLFGALRIEQANAPLALALEIPLKAAENTRVEGTVGLENARLTLQGHPYVADAVTGEVGFSERGLAWEDLRGQFAGEPWVSRARTEDAADGARIVVDTHMTAAVDDLLPEVRVPAERVQGATQWLVQVDAPGFPPHGGSTPVRVRVDSDLRGLALTLPEPWSKAPGEALALEAQASVDADGLTEPLRLKVGERADMRAAVTADGLRALAVGLGGAPPPELPTAAATVISGRLDRLALDGLAGGSGPDALAPWWLPPIERVDLTVDRLGLGGYRLREVALGVQPVADAWRVSLGGPDIAGTLQVPRPVAGQGLVAKLDRVHLHPATSAEESGDGAAARAPASVPSIDLTAAAVTVGERELGRLVLRLDGGGPGTRLERLELSNPALTLTARGRRGADGRSRLQLDAQSSDVGAALARLGYPGLVRGGEGSVNATLAWPGPLAEPVAVGLDGRIELAVNSGMLPAVEPGPGRLLGLLSVALLPRRLLLDFSDVTDEGLAFDRLVANLDADSGVLTPETFYLDGPAGRIDVSGPVDLVAGRLEQTVTVTPNISSTLPLIGLAGGPQTAILLFLAERLFGSGVDRLSRYRYRVTGPIDDPRIEPISLERSPATEEDDDPSPLERN